jgi:hypothetical protein
MAYQPKSYRKFLAGSVSAALVASAVGPVVANAASFSDVNPNDSHAANINALVELGYIKGFADGTFKPYQSITRGQVAKIFARILEDKGFKAPEKLEQVFDDVPLDAKDQELVKAAAIVKAAGVMTGTDGKLNPGQPITRQQMAKVLVEAFDLTKPADFTSKITDLDKADAWARDYIQTLEANGVTVVTEFKPKDNVTRAAFASFVKRALDAQEATKAPKVESVSAINSTQAVVTFDKEIGEATATNFTVDNGLTVVKAEVNPENKKEVTLTFNKELTDKETYKVTVNGVKSVAGVELKEATTVEFTYEIGEVSKIELTKTTFVNNDNIADFVKLTNDKGIDVTDKYTIEVTSTSGKVSNDGKGTVSNVTTNEVAYVQVTVKSGTTVVKQSDAIKVTLAPTAVTSLVGFGLGDDVDTVSAYKQAVKDGKLTSEMKKSETPNLELLVKDNNGSEKVLSASDVTKIENLTPTIATVSASNGELVVNAYSTGTAQVKLTIGDFVTTVSFTVKEDSKIANATLSKSNVYFNTALNPNENDSVNVNIVDQYGKDIKATVDANGNVSVGGNTVGTLTAKSSNTNVATVAVDTVTTESSSLPITITEVGKGTATITVEFKDTKGNVVFTKTLTVTGKDAGAFAGYVIETNATEIDLDKDSGTEPNDDAVNFTVYEVDAQGNKIQAVDPSNITLEIQGYDKNPEVKNYIDVVSGQPTVAVKDSNNTAFKSFAGSGTLNVDVKVNGTKIGTKAISYKNTDPVATKAVINTVDIVIDNDKIDGNTDEALTFADLFFGHYDANKGTYTVAPKLSVLDQFGKVIDWDTASPAGTLLNTDTVSSGIKFTVTNASDVVVNNADATYDLADSVELATGKSTGSFTVVVSDVDTAAVADILPAPVAFKVTIVD